MKVNLNSSNPFFIEETPEIDDVFPDYDEFDVLKVWREKDCMPPIVELDFEKDSFMFWLAYGVCHAETKFADAAVYDKYAFAGMVQGIFSGMFGGFGTDDERQEKIEGKLFFLNNRLVENGISAKTRAKALLLLLEDLYFNMK